MKNEDNLDKLRHSCAHLLAAAIVELWPKAKLAIGPSIEDGFYYDIDFGDEKVSDANLPKIEEKMQKILKDWKNFKRTEISKEDALKQFSQNEYKKELIKEFAKEKKKLTLYQSGKFSDLCRGGHIENPSKELRHFKLLSVAGAYWRGSEKNPMLTRIYGTCFPIKEGLESYLANLEEAKKRDHKILGKKHDLFTFSELVGAGLPLWTPKGALIMHLLDDFVWELRKNRGYERVEIPHITKKDLYEKSGHWEKFKDELFKIKTREGHTFAIKPMNCPHHTQIYARHPHSYKELPVRYANTTMVYRDEQTGELSGLSRVRSITQDDAHVFCRQSQVREEVNTVWDIIDEFYSACGFDLEVRLSLSDPETPKKYIGKRSDWDKSEKTLRDIAKERGVQFVEQIGEAAFYGPKIDFMAEDSLGRKWQVATIQLDMNMPERFGLICINERGEKEQVVMIHAAIMGSIERYLSILIEHFAGSFPVWLSPIQVKVLPITDSNLKYAKLVGRKLNDNGIRTKIDDRNETLQAKIRDAQLTKVPYMLIVGNREEKVKKVAVRLRDLPAGRQGEKDLGQLDLDKFLERISDKISLKSLEI